MCNWLVVESEQKPVINHCPLFVSVSSTEMLLLQDKGIWKYDLRKNRWDKFMDYSSDKLITIQFVAMFDQNTQCVYHCNIESKLVQIDVNAKTISVLSEDVNFNRCEAFIFSRNDDIHMVGANKKYLIFNGKTESIDEVKYPMSDQIWLASRQKATIKRDQSFVTVGINMKYSRLVFLRYLLQTNEWIEDEMQGLTHFASHMFTTTDEQYLFLFVGNDLFVNPQKPTKDIFILDLKKKKLLKSQIKIPIVNCIANLHKSDDLLVFGYVHQLWKSPEFSYVPSLPFYLIKLIRK